MPMLSPKSFGENIQKELIQLTFPLRRMLYVSSYAMLVLWFFTLFCLDLGNMAKADVEFAYKRLLGFIWLSLVCYFNTTPLFIISLLANLDLVCFYNCFILISDLFNDIRLFCRSEHISLSSKSGSSWAFSVFVCLSVGCVAGNHFWTFHPPTDHHA